MLTKHRTAWELLVKIVSFCQEKPRTITKLYYELGTSYAVLDRILKIAHNLKLIENHDNKYQTTKKGIEFLDKWTQLQTFLKEE